MLSLMKRALDPNTSISDKITYLTSITVIQSIRADLKNENRSVVEIIQDLISSANTRHCGFLLLQISVEQNPEICLKGHWHTIIQRTLKEPESYLLRIEACRSAKGILSQLAKDPNGCLEIVRKYLSVLIPVLLRTMEDNEWIQLAVECLVVCMKSFPTEVETYKESILSFVMSHTDCVSSVMFEPFADCFSELANCTQKTDAKTYQDDWSKYYLLGLNTVHSILNHFLTFVTEGTCKEYIVAPGDWLSFENTSNEVFPVYMHRVRALINLCKCLAKMLSTKTRYAIQVPVKETLHVIKRIFQVEDLKKLSCSSVENQILLSTFCQMQVAALVILEPLVINFSFVPHSSSLCHILYTALQASDLSNVSSGDISSLRHVVWKIFNIWLGSHAAKASFEICRRQQILDELLRDISIEEALFQKGDDDDDEKDAMNAERKNPNSSKEIVCDEALKVLEMLIYSGVTFLTRKVTDEILSKVVYIAYAIHPSHKPPFPYTNESCRKHLYELLLALTVVSKPDHCDSILAATAIFNNALQDASVEVSSVSVKAAAMSRQFLHPKKPPPLLRDPEDKKKCDLPSPINRISDWASEDNYVPNVSVVESISNASDNITPRVAQAFHHPIEKDMQSSDFMPMDTQYSEQAAEGHINGEDLSEIQNSSHGQDEESEDDEDEEEEEEDDDDRSFCEEEMNQDLQPEHMYIPSTSELQVMTPVHIAPESAHQNVTEQEFQELKPFDKSVQVIVDSNKSLQLNGMSDMPDGELQSTSTRNVANENGIYNSEEEEMEEEEEEEEEISHPGEKKVPLELYDIPVKKQKLELDEVNTEIKVEDSEQASRSPTLLEMKADFILSEVDDVKS